VLFVDFVNGLSFTFHNQKKEGLTFAKYIITMYQKWAEKPTQCSCACVNIGRQIRPYEDM
jgi:hypothetical protein